MSRKVLMHLNDDTGERLYSIEMAEEIGNWLDSFETRYQALCFIAENGYEYDQVTGYRDTTSKKFNKQYE